MRSEEASAAQKGAVTFALTPIRNMTRFLVRILGKELPSRWPCPCHSLVCRVAVTSTIRPGGIIGLFHNVMQLRPASVVTLRLALYDPEQSRNGALQCRRLGTHAISAGVGHWSACHHSSFPTHKPHPAPCCSIQFLLLDRGGRRRPTDLPPSPYSRRILELSFADPLANSAFAGRDTKY